MNILFLIFSFNTGGIERLIIDMANNMAKQNNKVSLCIINHDYMDPLLNCFDSSVQIFKLDREISSNSRIKYMISLSSFIRKNHIQAVHCHGLNCVLFSIIAKFQNPHTHFFNTVHDVPDFKSYNKIQIFIENMMCKKIIAISKTVETEILKRKVPQKKVVIIYNAINTDVFSMDLPKKNFKKNSVVIGNVARFMPEKKGQDILVEAIAILKEKYPAIQCHFAGAIDDTHISEYKSLVHNISRLGMTNNFFYHGNVEDIPSFLRNIDIFVLPSKYEGFGISLIEAMSMGIPCIASNIDGPAEIITSKELGILFETGNPQDLAQKIDYVIQHFENFDPDTISSYIHCHYDIENMVKQHLYLYQS